MENIQDEVIKIHHQYGTTEMANYQIQLLFDRNFNQLKTRIKELEGTIENNVTEVSKFFHDGVEIFECNSCRMLMEENEPYDNYCPNCGRKIVR